VLEIADNTRMLLLLLMLLAPSQTPARPPRPASPAPARPPATAAPQPQRQTFYTSTLSAAEMQNKQAVIETSYGTMILDLLPEAAPNHVAFFITQARAHAFDGTTFHRVIRMGLIQGGDPLSKDPSQAAKYGTGGLRQLRFETSAEKHTRGAVSSVLIPGERDSAGSQFFICVTDQPALDGQFTVWARVVEGIGVAEKISSVATTGEKPTERIVMTSVTIRDKPAPTPEPFSTESVADLAKAHVTLETSLGNLTLEFFPDRAPNHVRQFLRLAASGVYDGTTFHRIVPGFVVQGGYLATRQAPLDEKQQSYVRKLQPEFNPTPHVRGILSMARGDDPASADTSFFIVLDRAESLDQKYTVFGRVSGGLDVLDKMAGAPLDGETPQTKIELRTATVSR
jgi:peptidyl-prolyl cis-trans isomerase B (cyclophilin B)